MSVTFAFAPLLASMFSKEAMSAVTHVQLKPLPRFQGGVSPHYTITQEILRVLGVLYQELGTKTKYVYFIIAQ